MRRPPGIALARSGIRQGGDTVLKFLRSLPLLLALLPAVSTSAPSISVTTYHYDNLRTGWNRNETVLNASTFPSTFGVLETVALDDQVDAQPLLVPAQQIAGGVHDVLYVVTENNSVYALDANSGAILVQRNLGAPVHTPLGCGNNGPNVGITSTPVIDLASHEMFLISYTNGATPSYQLHALNLITLADAIAPVTVAATQTLTDGTTFAFNATYQRQRPGLLMMNGVIYAGFGSFCDFAASHSRGWLLGWKAATLTPLVHAELNDSQATSPTSFFLSSVWMSGFGVAGADNHIFFSTGNSDCNFYLSPELCPSQSTYDGVTNIQESVISMQPNLAKRVGVFTPSNVFAMDIADADLGAAGVLLLPTQANGSNLATIVSKDGRLFLLNRDDLSTALDMQQLADGCWCGPSYFLGSDGISRVVSSAGAALQTWQVQTSPAPQLVAEATANVQESEQDPGFFTVVSSHGERLDGAIIWAVARPSATAPLTLYAFAAAAANGTFKQLYSAPAGKWPYLGGNANIVPVVANGKVYVASYQSVMIFGPNGSTAAGTANSVDSTTAAASIPLGLTQRVSGVLLAVDGTTVTLTTRTGRAVTVDISRAVENEQVANLLVGQAYTALGTATGSVGTLQAASVMRAKRGSGAWPKDQW
jgi:outer membrane protein assembly factor BamB